MTPDAKKSASEYAEWAILFHKGIFVHVAVYADESGTHDPTGEQKGAREATVGGIIMLTDDIPAFREEWRLALKKHNAPFFHFREWRAAEVIARTGCPPSSDFKKNPYRDWDINRLKDFAVDMATVVGNGNKLTVATSIPTLNFHKAKIQGKISIGEDPYFHCLKGFFTDVYEMISEQRAPWKRQPVSFIFDQSQDHEWRNAVFDAHLSIQLSHPRFQIPQFQDKKDPLHYGLQAADMVAYRMRFIAGKWIDNDLWDGTWADFDKALFKAIFKDFEANKHKIGPDFIRGKLNYEWQRRYGKGI